MPIHTKNFNNNGVCQMNVVATDTINNDHGEISGYFLAFMGHDLVNSGLIDCEGFTFLPNLTEVHNTGSFHAHILFVHEDVVDAFTPNQYDIQVIIPHHEGDWSLNVGQEYLNQYFNAHPGV